MLITPKGEVVSEYRNDDKNLYVAIDRHTTHEGVVVWENTYFSNQSEIGVELYYNEQHAENAAEDFVLPKQVSII